MCNKKQIIFKPATASYLFLNSHNLGGPTPTKRVFPAETLLKAWRMLHIYDCSSVPGLNYRDSNLWLFGLPETNAGSSILSSRPSSFPGFVSLPPADFREAEFSFYSSALRISLSEPCRWNLGLGTVVLLKMGMF